MYRKKPSIHQPMTSRQRVLAALEHKQPDRVPRDLGGTTATGVNIVAYHNLIEYLGLNEEATLFSNRVRLANLSEEILNRFKIDTRPLIVGGGFGVGEPNPDGTFTDGYGVVRSLPDERGHWYVVDAPLSGPITKSDIASASHKWPDPKDPIYTQGLAEKARQLHQETEFAIVLTIPIGSVHVAQWLRGFDEWLMDLVTDLDLSIYLLDCLFDRWMEVTRRLLDVVGDNIDVLFYAEDIAFHNGPMVSPRTYEQILHPYQKRVFQFLKDHSNAKILYHNCGSVTWQISDLIEMGVDALNPVQVSSHDMGDTKSLKERFGEKIAFWGGIDTGYVLPQGTVDEVHAEACKRVGDLSIEGGYVLASVHNIQADVPPQNICAIWDAADRLQSNQPS